jgi:dihydrofolate synthase/folylpolyglutamate synthase
VGLYTSPHLSAVNERFRLDGQPIPDDLLAVRMNEILERFPKAATLTYFEFGTVTALWHFFREQADIVLLETGLGGRLDATNCCVPLVTALTSVSMDHQEYLGHTLAAIAAEKAGIIKKGVPVVVGRQAAESLGVFLETARAQGAPVTVAGRDCEWVAPDGFRGRGGTLSSLQLGLRGPHQFENAEVALGCLEALVGAGFELSADAIRRGLRNTRWPGRLEWFDTKPPLLLDGAHNVDGVRTLLEALKAEWPGLSFHLVFGVLGDKDFVAMAQALFPACQSVHLAPIDSPRAVPMSSLLAAVSPVKAGVKAHLSLHEAIEGAQRACQPNEFVVVCGSLVLVGQVRQWLQVQGMLGAMRHRS